MSALKIHLLRTTILVGVAIASSHAFAQGATTPAATTPTTEQEKAAVANQGKPGVARTGSGKEDTIVVTGSRLGTTEFNSPAPIQVITAESIQLRGITDTAAALQQSSIASGSIQQNQTTIGFGQSGIQGGNGLSSINLRGLDALRTLVLVDGRRVAAAGAGNNIGPVDLSVIPISIISRVEILKDGASSVYGSDAIGGVVNVITRRDLNGGFLTINTTQPSKEGGDSVQVAGGLGISSSRGFISATAEYYRQSRISLASRSFLNCAADYLFDPNSGARIDIIDPLTNEYKCFNVMSGVARVSGQLLQYDPTNARGPYGAYQANPYLGLGFHRVDIAGNSDSFAHGFWDNPIWTNNSSAVPETRRKSIFVTGGYDLGSNINVSGQLLASRRETWNTVTVFYQPTINARHPSNPFGVAATPFIIGPRGAPGVDPRFLTRVDFYQATLDFNGELNKAGLFSGWKWDIYGELGKSKAIYTGISPLSDVYQVSNGNPADGECFQNGVTESPLTHRPCVAINWFSPGKLSGLEGFTPDEAAFLLTTTVGRTKYIQNVAEGSFSGDLINLPAGPMRVALGSQFIYTSINDQPDPESQRGNIGFFAPDPAFGALTTVGHQHSLDVYAETVIPVLKNAPFARDLTLTASGRASHPQGINWHWTYEGGVNWGINRFLRMRGTYGTSFRAPALFEKYLGASTLGFQQVQTDPCISPSDTIVQQRCLAAGIPANYNGGANTFARVTQTGNLNLKPETSRAFTVGGVLTPGFVDLSIAVDYFDIVLKNKVASLTGQEPSLCFLAADYPNSPYCSQFVRDMDPTSFSYLNILSVSDPLLNVAIQKTNGLDFTVRFNQRLGHGLVLRMDNQYTRTFHDRRQAFEGGVTTEQNGALLQPKFTGTSILSLDHTDWTLSWTTQVIGPTNNVGLNGVTANGSNTHFPTTVLLERGTGLVLYHGLTFRKKFEKAGVTAQIGVQNLFDKAPPKVSVNATIYRRGTSPLSLYDFLGRRVFVTLNKTF